MLLVAYSGFFPFSTTRTYLLLFLFCLCDQYLPEQNNIGRIVSNIRSVARGSAMGHFIPQAELAMYYVLDRIKFFLTLSTKA